MKKEISKGQKLISEIQGEVNDVLSEVHCTCMCIEYDLARGKQPTKKELRKYVADIKSANRSIREYLRSLFQREEEKEIPEVSNAEISEFLGDVSSNEDKRITLTRFWAELCIEYDLDLDDFELRNVAHSYLLYVKTGKYIW